MRGSLTLRVALLAALWVALGLAGAGWFVAGLAGEHILAAADARLAAQLDGLIASAGADATGQPVVPRLPAEPGFERPLSGQYWQVSGPGGALRSRSLWDAALPRPAAPLEPGTMLAREATGPRGEPLRLLERWVALPDAPGPLLVQVAADSSATTQELARLRRGLALVFGVLGLGLVGGVAAQVVWAMRPLRQARAALVEVRAGRRDALALPAPAEIAPLVREVDALVAQNRTTVERARQHVGNLAHALKTPVAVLRNALGQARPDAALAGAQLAEIEHVLRHHLARARVAALGGSAGSNVPPLAVAEEVAAALRRLRATEGLELEITGDAGAELRVDRQDLVEMLGNLLENACAWASKRVAVQVAGAGKMVHVSVEDDGPGMPEGQEAEALARGVRLDEASQGSGLGLAIVADLAGLYGGALAFSRSPALGGACATLSLPTTARQ